MHHAWTFVTLIVAAPRRRIPIRGTVTKRLAPGIAAPIDLRLTNPNRSALQVGHLTVSITSVVAPLSDATHRCTVDDFAVTQFSGRYGFTLPPSTTRSLGAAGIASTQWPHVAMVDRRVNQDGCKHASLKLRFIGTVVGSHR